MIISECCVQLHKTNITYTLSSTRGYSGVIYKNNKYRIIKLRWGKNIYIYYNKKYLHEFIYNHEKCDSIYLRRVSKKVGGDFLLKLEILFKFRMFSGSRLYSFAPRKAKERWPVDKLHLRRFNCDIFLVLRPDTQNLS